MKVTVLGSGSRGNSVLVESGDVRLLVDAGFSGRDMERRLAAVEIAPESISALLITHDHSDHTRGMGVVARRWGIPIYMTEPTRAACAKLLDGTERLHRYGSDEPVEIGGLVVAPFLTVHDAVDPIAVTVTERATGEKLGIATDLGRATTPVRAALQGCDVLILESNHDPILLRESHYPWSVKSRIASGHGHLSNRAAAELATELYHKQLATVILAHLSEAANEPEIARDTVGAALEKLRYRGPVHVAAQEAPMATMDVTSLRAVIAPPQLSLL